MGAALAPGGLAPSEPVGALLSFNKPYAFSTGTRSIGTLVDPMIECCLNGRARFHQLRLKSGLLLSLRGTLRYRVVLVQCLLPRHLRTLRTVAMPVDLVEFVIQSVSLQSSHFRQKNRERMKNLRRQGKIESRSLLSKVVPTQVH